MRLLPAFALLLVTACQPGPKASTDGAVLFDTTCAVCHAHDGRGVPAMRAQFGVPDLSDAAVQSKLTDEQVLNVIRNGSQNRRMPPWRGVYSEEQLRALVAHVRSFKR
jgi:mono/diheme cytochrome c family protein